MHDTTQITEAHIRRSYRKALGKLALKVWGTIRALNRGGVSSSMRLDGSTQKMYQLKATEKSLFLLISESGDFLPKEVDCLAGLRDCGHVSDSQLPSFEYMLHELINGCKVAYKEIADLFEDTHDAERELAALEKP